MIKRPGCVYKELLIKVPYQYNIVTVYCDYTMACKIVFILLKGKHVSWIVCMRVYSMCVVCSV